MNLRQVYLTKWRWLDSEGWFLYQVNMIHGLVKHLIRYVHFGLLHRQ
jgi:hypothetical protein